MIPFKGPEGRVGNGRRTAEGVSEELRRKAMKQRPKRAPGEDDQSSMKDMEEEWEDAKKRAKVGRTKTPQQLVETLFGQEDKKFSKSLAIKAASSGKETGKALTADAPEVSDAELEELAGVKPERSGEPSESAEGATAIEVPEFHLKEAEPADGEPLATAEEQEPEQGPQRASPMQVVSTPRQGKQAKAEQPVAKLMESANEPPSIAPAGLAESVAPLQTESIAPQAKPAPVPPRPDLVELIEKVASHLEVMQASDRVETTITLRKPPLFAGTEITLTEFKSAKGEFNVSFTNLTPAAKALVDNPQQQDALRQALEQKGYPMHIITTSQESRSEIARNEHGERTRDDESGEQQEQEPDEEEA